MIAQADALHRAFAPAIMNDPPLRGYLQQISARLLAAARDVAFRIEVHEAVLKFLG